MTIRTKTVTVCHNAPGGAGYVQVPVELSMSVTIQRGALPVVVRGYGLNEARFASLEAVYNTFCGFLAPIRLDYGGSDEIAACLESLGFTPPR
jgi:hypothetical protein